MFFFQLKIRWEEGPSDESSPHAERWEDPLNRSVHLAYRKTRKATTGHALGVGNASSDEHFPQPRDLSHVRRKNKIDEKIGAKCKEN